MPSFVKNGPDIPERLLQIHEEGDVVFFCGAGISYPAQLPSFKGLVQRLYNELNVIPDTVQKTAIKTNKYDTAISLIESDHIGGRDKVRETIAKILTPNLEPRRATATHEAILTLSRNREDRLRLVTTNFDRIFEEVIKKKDLDVECFQAPLLPVPKNRWDGLVYLHGLIPEKLTSSRLDRLVISSGDFGLAYLTERWAARFVSELFRNYTVCFIGYSIDDPVLRYMMDALAADRLLGEFPPDMYAFGSYSKGNKSQINNEWRAKNVIPILYPEYKKHYYLHKTLKEWAATYRDGVRGKEMIITEHAPILPLSPSKSDFSVGRVLWALTDDLAAKHFADLDPAPPLKWLEPLSEKQFGHDDLARFGVIPVNEKDHDLQFSFLNRPSSYKNSPWMQISGFGQGRSTWDYIMQHIARWLLRYLDDPNLILWLVTNGGELHKDFQDFIRHRIIYLEKLNQNGNTDKLTEIQLKSPQAFPRQEMKILWSLFFLGKVKTAHNDVRLYDWIDRFNISGLTPLLRIELRELFEPRILLRSPDKWFREYHNNYTSRLKDLVDWEIVLSCDHANSFLQQLKEQTKWQSALPELLTDFSTLLKDALDLSQELGGANEKSDLSFIHRPTISDHEQNRNFRDWTVLVDITREAWIRSIEKNVEISRNIAIGWWHTPYPLFKRLALFSGTFDQVISPDTTIKWLLSEMGWWLWSTETRREILRVISLISPKVKKSDWGKLEKVILGGPPRHMYRDNIERKEWERVKKWEIYLRLKKAEEAGAPIGEEAIIVINDFSMKHPNVKFSNDKKEEFPFWFESGFGEDFSFPAEQNLPPNTKEELAEWLKKYPESKISIQNDGWRKICQDDHKLAVDALTENAKLNLWPIDRWQTVLMIGAEESYLKKSWANAIVTLIKAPDEVIQELGVALSSWLLAQAKDIQENEAQLLSLISRSLRFEYKGTIDGIDDLLSQAINHPIGQVAEALLYILHRNEKREEGIKREVRELLTELCNQNISRYRPGRIILSAHVLNLYRKDKTWTKTYLIPLFDWNSSIEESTSAWRGFLWTPRVDNLLLSELKKPILNTASYVKCLGKSAESYASLLTFIALNKGDIFSYQELKLAVEKLPKEELEVVSQTLVRAIQGMTDKRSKYLENRIKPFIQKIWPKSKKLNTQKTSNNFARLCVEAKDDFPDLFKLLRPWLQPIDDFVTLRLTLKDFETSEYDPSSSLEFLYIIVGNDPQRLPKELPNFLEQIGTSDSSLVQNRIYVHLEELLKKRGQI